MSDYEKLKETLSALVDNEAGKGDQLELRRLVRSLENHTDLVDIYQRYTLAHAVMNGETANLLPVDFVKNVRAALDQENMVEPAPTISASAVNAGNFNWFKSAGRVAIAASIAIIAVYLTQLRSPVAVPDVAAVQQQIPVSNPVLATIKNPVIDSNNNRVLNQSVMTVSAGDERPFERPVDDRANTPTGCVVDAVRADRSNLIWEKELPAGYVLCKQNDQSKQCESSSSKIGCYLN